MTIGGYKAFKFTFSGGRSDTLSERAEHILTEVSDGIIGLGQGWSRGLAFADGPKALGAPSDEQSSVIVLKHTSGAEMMLAYALTAASGLPAAMMFRSTGASASVPMYQIGLCVSMSDGSQPYDYFLVGTTGTITVPDDATPILGGAHSPNANSVSSFAKENSGGSTYSYTAIVKDTQVFIVARKDSWSANIVLFYCAGSLVGAQAYSGGPAWGSLAALRLSNASTTEPSLPSIQSSINSEDGKALSSTLAASRDSLGSQAYISRSGTATERTCCSSDKVGHVLGAEASAVTAEMQKTGSSGRMMPIWCGIASIDPDLYGVVKGDGFKGFLDTDAICYTRRNFYTKGQTFNGGGRMYLGNGIVIGWDASNTVNIFD